MTIKLGDVAKDKITQFTGVVAGITKRLTNVDSYTLCPQKVNADGTPAKMRSFDATACQFVKASKVRVMPVDRVAHPPDLGDVIEANITGLTGVVTAITTWIEGCVLLEVQPTKLTKDGEPPERLGYDERSVKVLRRAKPKPAPVRTGGPRPEPIRAVSR